MRSRDWWWVSRTRPTLRLNASPPRRTRLHARMLQLNLIATLAFAGVAVLLGYGLCWGVPLFARYNLPAPVVGGLAVAIVLSVLRGSGVTLVAFDTVLERPLMNAFFASIGFQVSARLLRRGGGAVLLLVGFATLGAVLQNVVGVGLAVLLGKPALFGVVCGSLTLTGGPATGIAFAPQLEAAGVPAAEATAVVAAIIGIVVAGVISAPLSTVLIERLRRRNAVEKGSRRAEFAREITSGPEGSTPPLELAGDAGVYSLLKGAVLLLLAVYLGS